MVILLLTYNEEKNIEACLDSVAALGAPVFVVDSFSTDRTTDILRERGVAFVQHPFEHYAAQRNWAQANCPFPEPWVLHLDAGERATPELVRWIENEFDPEAAPNGYLFSRRTIFMDRWIRHGGHYPSYHLRLFRRKHGHCEAKAYDQHFVCTGRLETATKGADILDQVAENLVRFSTGHLRWALIEAVERLSRQQPAGEVEPRFWGSPIERRRWLKSVVFDRTPLFLRAFLYFLYRYFLRLGFLDGAPGLAFHFLQGCWFRFLVDSAMLEIRLRQKKTGASLRQVVLELYGEQVAQTIPIG
ncbi:MAG: glycosyltransferase family 2 protein [Saprospiraceae bacterium]|nr:glycosyltransferase family 2 protein [Saprospiraceae bacterium]